ncbi:hypothetical protein JW613_32895 [Streptomyces smyrnaeus]|uniref:Uncharacterized protein n=1 Tax=Streptomyces smyrnaeus TaxID=1387713 RepID=A0ABS3Y5Z7_9ACTN|nr:hypothetical protein [Streptomyces smyrnaeus]MBO8203041.1 hypothetical protein [Streptomyces smyrnaeus]
MELANQDLRIALSYQDAAKKRITELERVVQRAKRPEDIWTAEAQLQAADSWHCDLAPNVAAERWAKVQELSDACDNLEARWNDLELEAEDIRRNAAKAHADALRKGVKAPSTAAQVMEADAQLEGCSLALRETVADLYRARASYESLLKDRAFLGKYRKAVIAEFNAQRKRAAEAFNAAAGAINETRRRFGVLHSLTMGGLLDIPEDAQGYLGFSGKGWLQADLSSAISLISRQVGETDPFLSGEFLTAPMEDVNATAIETAERVKAEIDQHRQNHYSKDGILSTRMI